MMANPFYVQPGGDVTPALRGLSGAVERMGVYERQEKQRETENKQADQLIDLKNRELTAAEQAAKKAAEIQALALEAYQSGDPNKMLAVASTYPEYSTAIKMALGFKSKATADNYFRTAVEFLNDPTVDKAQELVEKRRTFLRNEGVLPAGSSHTDNFMDEYKKDPDKAVRDLEATVISAFPERWKAYKDAEIAPEKGGTQGDVDETGEKKTAAMRNFEKYQELQKADPEAAESFARLLGIKGGPKEQFAILKYLAEIADYNSRILKRANEQKIAAEKREQNKVAKISVIDNVLREVASAGSEAKEAWTATGIPGVLTGWVPSTPAYNLKRRVSTIQANLAFNKLNELREVSPTGGALGQVSNFEINLLKDSVSALDPNMGEERFKEALQNIQKHFAILKNHINSPGVPLSYKVSSDPAQRQIYRNWLKELGLKPDATPEEVAAASSPTIPVPDLKTLSTDELFKAAGLKGE
jgi:hypothetical protein